MAEQAPKRIVDREAQKMVGDRLKELGKHELAEGPYREAEDVDGLLWVAGQYLHAGKLLLAELACHHAGVTLRPDQYALALEIAIERGDMDTAGQAATKLGIVISAEQHRRMGDCWIERNDVAKAEAAYAKANTPIPSASYRQMADRLVEQNMLDQAAKLYRKSLGPLVEPTPPVSSE